MVANCILGKEDTDFHPASPLWVPESPALMTIPPSTDGVVPSAMHERVTNKDLATASTLWEQNHLNYSWSQNTLMSESIKWCSLSNKRWCVPKATYRACKHWLCMLYSKAYNRNRPGAREQAMYRLKCAKKRKRLMDKAKAEGGCLWQIDKLTSELKERQKQWWNTAEDTRSRSSKDTRGAGGWAIPLSLLQKNYVGRRPLLRPPGKD